MRQTSGMFILSLSLSSREGGQWSQGASIPSIAINVVSGGSGRQAASKY